MRVRLWLPWLGPDGWVPAGEEVEVSAGDGAAICQVGHGEAVRTPEVAALATSERAVAVLPQRPRRRRRKRTP